MLKGTINLKGDKSISHRVLIFAAMATGQSSIINLSACDDVKRTMDILEKCNIKIIKSNHQININSTKVKSNAKTFDCGNSGTTARLMLGFLPANGITGTLYGDESLSQRPMSRVRKPLQELGINISNNKTLPISFKKSHPKNINYTLKVPSAQVKTSLILAALMSDKKSIIVDPFKTRDHTERILKYLGHHDKQFYKFKFQGFQYNVPGDISNASFIITAAALIPNSDIKIKNILYNKTRIGYINILKKMGVKIKTSNHRSEFYEEVCDIEVKYSTNIKNINLNNEDVVSMIDEIPIFALLATQAKGTLIIKGANELRIKESDRIKAIVYNLKQFKADINELDDGIRIKGPKRLYSASIKTFSDHRIAMTMAIAAIIAEKKFVINKDIELLSHTSFPEFYHLIKLLYV